jgi:hypothetical protein
MPFRSGSNNSIARVSGQATRKLRASSTDLSCMAVILFMAGF